MKKIALIGALLLVITSFKANAEIHADAALIHTQMAIEHGKAGNGRVLAHHANEALIHAKKAAELAQGESKTQMEAAVMALELAIEHGKKDIAVYIKTATKAAEDAEIHLKAGIK